MTQTSVPLPLRSFATVAFLAAAACGGSSGNPDRVPGRDSASAISTGDSTAPADSPFEGTIGRSEREGTPFGVATLHAIRTAPHANFERVVFEFREEVPGYVLEYATGAPAHCGSGDPANVSGSAHLVVRMTPARAHEFFGERAASTIPARDLRIRRSLLEQLLLTCDFEAEVTWVLGLSARRPYRVITLEAPPRIVVDVERAAM